MSWGESLSLSGLELYYLYNKEVGNYSFLACKSMNSKYGGSENASFLVKEVLEMISLFILV